MVAERSGRATDFSLRTRQAAPPTREKSRLQPILNKLINYSWRPQRATARWSMTISLPSYGW
jgi:hypothetical protein